MNDLEIAEKQIRSLEDQRETIIGRSKALAVQRQQISHAAYASGNQKAKASLDKMNAETQLIDLELENIASAIREANRLLDAAKGDEARAADRANALKLRTANAEFKELGDDADDALWDFIQAITKMKVKLDELHSLGAASPTAEQFRINCTNAIKTKIQELPSLWVRDFEFQLLAPNQKKLIKEICAGWFAMIERQIAQRLGEDTKDKAA